MTRPSPLVQWSMLPSVRQVAVYRRRFCLEVLGEDALALHARAAAGGCAPERFYCRLYGYASNPSDLCWHESASHALAAEARPHGLATRAGHSAVALSKNRVLISGGLRETSTGSLDLCVVDLLSNGMRR